MPGVVPGGACGSCTLALQGPQCCRVGQVGRRGRGCGIHPSRPYVCRPCPRLAAPGCHHPGGRGTMRIQGPTSTTTNAAPPRPRLPSPNGERVGRNSRGGAGRPRHRCADRTAGGGGRNRAPARRGQVRPNCPRRARGASRLASSAGPWRLRLSIGCVLPQPLSRMVRGRPTSTACWVKIELRVEVEIAKMAARWTSQIRRKGAALAAGAARLLCTAP